MLTFIFFKKKLKHKVCLGTVFSLELAAEWRGSKTLERLLLGFESQLCHLCQTMYLGRFLHIPVPQFPHL